MALDDGLRQWFHERWVELVSGHPKIEALVEKYALDLEDYILIPRVDTLIGSPGTINETDSASSAEANWANFEEDIEFLATFEEYIEDKLPKNFQSVLDAGIGQWTYSKAMAKFFQAYNPEVSIEGRDNNESYVEIAKRYLEKRSVKRIESLEGDINLLSGTYDLVVNMNPNLGRGGYIVNSEKGSETPANEFYHNIWKSISPDGLFVMGLSYPQLSKDEVRDLLSPFFKGIDINENRHATEKSIYPIHYIITAKPKLAAEIIVPAEQT